MTPGRDDAMARADAIGGDPTLGRRRPGRPIRGADMRENILDVAERLFADGGYSGTALREIATAAGVTQALVSYYFGSKRTLFETVFKRRASVIIDRRIVLLAELEAKPAPPGVEALVAAYLRPQFEMKQSGPGGRAFVRLQTRLHNEPEELAFRLRREVYDSSTKRFIAAFRRALPHLDEADVVWRMTFLIGAYLYMLSDADRLGDLSEGRYAADNPDEIMARLVHFLIGGMGAKPGRYA